MSNSKLTSSLLFLRKEHEVLLCPALARGHEAGKLQEGEAQGPACAPQPEGGGSKISSKTSPPTAKSSSLALLGAGVVSKRWVGMNR